MVLTEAQKQIAVDRHRFRVVNCGRRFGKTTLAVLEMVTKALSQDDRRIVYIAPTYQQARDIAWQELKKICQPAAININESRLEITLESADKGHSVIWLRGWESIETLRGQKFDFIVIDEVAMMRDFFLHFEEVIRPTLTDRKGEVMFISTPKGFNHFYDLFNQESKDEDYKSFHFTSYDNPFLPVEELDKAKKELPEDRFAQEYMADFRKSEGLVYKEFNRERHTFNRLSDLQFVKTFGGLDFGFTNPCAAITIKKDRNAIYWVTDEWYKTQKTDAQIADYVAALRWDECYPDPESASGIEELKRRGINTREVIKNRDSVRNGINVVREMLNTNRLRISKTCQNLIWELETYSYPQSKPDHNEEEKPIKENDHALDALRYALTMDNSLTVEQFYDTNYINSSEPNINPAL